MKQKELTYDLKTTLFHRNRVVFRLFIVAQFGGHTTGNRSIY